VAPFRQPGLAVAALLLAEIEAAGIHVRGQPQLARLGPAVYEEDEPLAQHTSPPLSEVVQVILKVSQNLHSTMLPLVVGAVLGDGGDRAHGFRVIAERFQEAGVPSAPVALESGAGGGRTDLLTARWLVGLLQAMARHEGFPAFFGALPVSGVDGTLATSLRRPSVRGRVHAKTGTLVYPTALGSRWIYLSKALAGYVDLGKEGRPEDLLVFAIVLANTPVDDRKAGAERLVRIQEKILEAVVAHEAERG
jgi:D-alanyl-D-alanine carboxypeptidase/D-alanyl-D-alanine-endopeptidase (penicillin-binding protein 4)